MSSAHLWGFCRGWCRRGGWRGPRRLPPPPSVLEGVELGSVGGGAQAARGGMGSRVLPVAPGPGGPGPRHRTCTFGGVALQAPAPSGGRTGSPGLKALGEGRGGGTGLILPWPSPPLPGPGSLWAVSQRHGRAELRARPGPEREWGSLSRCQSGSAGQQRRAGRVLAQAVGLRPGPPAGAAAAAGPACPASGWSAAASSSPA